MSEAPLVYDLTPMTRKADQGRRFVIGGFDIQKRTLLIGGVGFVPGAALTGMLYPMLGIWAILLIPFTMAAAFWLIEGRSSQGMKLRNWQTLLDKKKNRNGAFFICGHEIDVDHSDITILRSLTAPVNRTKTEDSFVDDLFALEDAA